MEARSNRRIIFVLSGAVFFIFFSLRALLRNCRRSVGPGVINNGLALAGILRPQSWSNDCDFHPQSRPIRLWRVDETYVWVKGRWCCLSRAIDSGVVPPSISCCQRSVTLMLPNACFARRSAIDLIPNLE